MSFSSVDPNKTMVIRELPDQPSNQGFRAEALKLLFDTGSENMRQALNGLIDALNSATAAGNLGFRSTDGVQASNVQAAIENVQAQLVGITQDGVADGSITGEKLAAEALDGAKTKPGTFIQDVTEEVTFSNRVGNSDHTKDLKFYFVSALNMVIFTGSITFKGVGAINQSELAPASRRAYFGFTGTYGYPKTAKIAYQTNCAVGRPYASYNDDGFGYCCCVDLKDIPASAVNDIEVLITGWYFIPWL